MGNDIYIFYVHFALRSSAGVRSRGGARRQQQQQKTPTGAQQREGTAVAFAGHIYFILFICQIPNCAESLDIINDNHDQP